MIMTPALVAADTAWHGPWFWPWFLLIPLFWILLIVLFFTIGRRFWWRRHWDQYQAGPNQEGHYQAGPYQGDLRAARPGAGSAGSAESVLRERFARGEIDETEYRQRLEVLRGDSYQG